MNNTSVAFIVLKSLEDYYKLTKMTLADGYDILKCDPGTINERPYFFIRLTMEDASMIKLSFPDCEILFDKKDE